MDYRHTDKAEANARHAEVSAMYRGQGRASREKASKLRVMARRAARQADKAVLAAERQEASG